MALKGKLLTLLLQCRTSLSANNNRIFYRLSELDPAQSFVEQVLRKATAFQGRAGQGRLLEAGSRKDGGGQTVQTPFRDLAAESEHQEAISFYDRDDDDDGGNGDSDDDA